MFFYTTYVFPSGEHNRGEVYWEGMSKQLDTYLSHYQDTANKSIFVKNNVPLFILDKELGNSNLPKTDLYFVLGYYNQLGDPKLSWNVLFNELKENEREKLTLRITNGVLTSSTPIIFINSSKDKHASVIKSPAQINYYSFLFLIEISEKICQMEVVFLHLPCPYLIIK
jgi:hypothetical protein